MHDSWGVGLGFKGFTVRDAAGHTVLSAPSGQVGLDPFALPLMDVRVSRLELDGLDLRLRVAATARSRLRSLAIQARPRSLCRAPRPRTETSPGLPPSSAPRPKAWPAPPRRSTG